MNPMMSPDNKIAGAILGEPPKQERGDDFALEVAAGEIMKAIEAKSSSQLVGALKAFVSMCEETEEEYE